MKLQPFYDFLTIQYLLILLASNAQFLPSLYSAVFGKIVNTMDILKSYFQESDQYLFLFVTSGKNCYTLEETTYIKAFLGFVE